MTDPRSTSPSVEDIANEVAKYAAMGASRTDIRDRLKRLLNGACTHAKPEPVNLGDYGPAYWCAICGALNDSADPVNPVWRKPKANAHEHE